MVIVVAMNISRFSNLVNRAMFNNEQDYPELREFRPERFLRDGKLDGSVRDSMEIAFGFGRRWALFILSTGRYLNVSSSSYSSLPR